MEIGLKSTQTVGGGTGGRNKGIAAKNLGKREKGMEMKDFRMNADKTKSMMSKGQVETSGWDPCSVLQEGSW